MLWFPSMASHVIVHLLMVVISALLALVSVCVNSTAIPSSLVPLQHVLVSTRVAELHVYLTALHSALHLLNMEFMLVTVLCVVLAGLLLTKSLILALLLQTALFDVTWLVLTAWSALATTILDAPLTVISS
jgi:hypothetical protein